MAEKAQVWKSNAAYFAAQIANEKLAPREQWVLDAVREACQLFANQQGLHEPAALMAAAHPRAIDYLKQAPVIVLASSCGRRPRKAHERAFVVNTMRRIVETGPKLREATDAYRVAYPLRRLAAGVLSPQAWAVVELLSELSPSDLAQSIPEKHQRKWLRFLRDWTDKCWARGHDRRLHFRWAAINFKKAIGEDEYRLLDIADLIIRAPDRFQGRFTLAEAIRAMERWHVDLARRRNTEDFVEKYGIGFGDEMDYGPLPLTWKSESGLLFTALRSGEALFLEGAAMHHCVADYVADVLEGRSRIYSIKEGDRRLATVEFKATSEMAVMQQCKAACNKRPNDKALAAAKQFMLVCTDAIREAAPNYGEAIFGKRADFVIIDEFHDHPA